MTFLCFVDIIMQKMHFLKVGEYRNLFLRSHHIFHFCNFSIAVHLSPADVVFHVVNTEPIPCPDGSEIVCGKCALLCLHGLISSTFVFV